ncbi:MAG: M24 family metallopeptidase [Methanomassiliicoccaceae archaeon]|jgi:Xaa-Pro dipeptidase|nr:Xaa-Pro peptidase family protein [Methanomassiliicoccaceae archaeon]HQA20484.1 Xaa-Pro peptidase family protein [Methanomassiliicoccaceae archaeon]
MNRVQRIFSRIDEPVDAILLMSSEEPLIDVSFFYATGIKGGLFEECPAILWPDGRLQLITSRLEETSARTSSAEISVFANKAERDALLAEALRGVGRLGINAAGITHANAMLVRRMAPHAQLTDVGDAIKAARLVKDEDEIDAIRKACDIASRVADEIPSMLVEGVSESEMGAEIAYRMQKLGATGTSFDTISAFGAGSAEPHYHTGDRKLRPGEPALFDFGCKYDRYCSDITRTYFLGSVPEKFERVYQVVLEAQQKALDAIRAGARGRDVDAAAREHIEGSGFPGGLIHSTGHGLGLAVHDGGRMAPNDDLVLEENMVMTVEPGIYIPGEGGVRIEDDIRVTKDGYEMLTSADKRLRAV